MHYFIPAWYGNQFEWRAPFTAWYNTGHHIEFDETIHQVKIFLQQEEPVQLLLPLYQPQLRYFLHRHDLLEVSYWSVFDDLQGVGTFSMRMVQLSDLDFDEWCDFVYTPFVISVYRKGKRIAQVEFSQEGLISHVNRIKGESVLQTEIYDDRGFLSSILYYSDGQPAYQEFFDDKGVWQFREYFDKREWAVSINPTLEMKFMKLHYHSLGELIVERMRLHVAIELHEDDQLVIASHKNHEAFLLPMMTEDDTVIVTTYAQRHSIDELLQMQTSMHIATALIVDSKEWLEKAQKELPKHIVQKVHYLPPFDSRLRLGMSQQKKVEKIYYQLNPHEFSLEDVIPVVTYVSEHPQTELTIGIFNHSIQYFEETITEWMNTHLKKEDVLEEVANPLVENQLEEDAEWVSRIQFKQFMNEVEFIRELEYTRLVVDMSQHPDPYTQIASISAGIPQVNVVETEYVEHEKNGYIIAKPSEFDTTAHYYLDELKYWNEALVHAIDKIRENTGNAFIEKWHRWTK